MSLSFKKTTEDFVCENCGKTVTGNGYTNHCPHCLHSKHVDIHPGDRSCSCQGLMKPIAVVSKKGGYAITFKCQKCGAQKQCKSAKNDDFDVMLAIVKQGGV